MRSDTELPTRSFELRDVSGLRYVTSYIHNPSALSFNLKDVVMTVSCFDGEGEVVKTGLDGLSFSQNLGEHYMYLKPEKDENGLHAGLRFHLPRGAEKVVLSVIKWRPDSKCSIDEMQVLFHPGLAKASGLPLQIVSARGVA